MTEMRHFVTSTFNGIKLLFLHIHTESHTIHLTVFPWFAGDLALDIGFLSSTEIYKCPSNEQIELIDLITKLKSYCFVFGLQN